MKRRSLLQGAAAAALGAPALSGLAQQAVTLKFHTFMAPQSLVWLSMHKPWMEKVEKDSGGRIKFEAYPAMQLGGTPVQLYDQARDGVVDIVWTLPGNTAGRFPRPVPGAPDRSSTPDGGGWTGGSGRAPGASPHPRWWSARVSSARSGATMSSCALSGSAARLPAMARRRAFTAILAPAASTSSAVK